MLGEWASCLHQFLVKVVYRKVKNLIWECFVPLFWSEFQCVLHSNDQRIKFLGIELPYVPKEVFIYALVSCSRLNTRLLGPPQDFLFGGFHVLMLLLEPLDLKINIDFELQSILIEGLLGWLGKLVIADNNHFLQVAGVLIFNTPKLFFMSQLLFEKSLLLSLAQFLP